MTQAVNEMDGTKQHNASLVQVYVRSLNLLERPCPCFRTDGCAFYLVSVNDILLQFSGFNIPGLFWPGLPSTGFDWSPRYLYKLSYFPHEGVSLFCL